MFTTESMLESRINDRRRQITETRKRLKMLKQLQKEDQTALDNLTHKRDYADDVKGG